jgi:NAD/NADP transhydrogenase alpha subunit
VPINNASIFTVLMIIAIIIILHSQIHDVVAYTVMVLTNAYGSKNIINAGDHLGRFNGTNMFVAIFDDHRQHTRTYIPHSILYLSHVQKI